jgi:hypothetical protein
MVGKNNMNEERIIYRYLAQISWETFCLAAKACSSGTNDSSACCILNE